MRAQFHSLLLYTLFRPGSPELVPSPRIPAPCAHLPRSLQATILTSPMPISSASSQHSTALPFPIPSPRPAQDKRRPATYSCFF